MLLVLGVQPSDRIITLNVKIFRDKSIINLNVYAGDLQQVHVHSLDLRICVISTDI